MITKEQKKLITEEQLNLITKEELNLITKEELKSITTKLSNECKKTLKEDIIEILLEENDNEKKRLTEVIFDDISTICAPRFLNHDCIELRF